MRPKCGIKKQKQGPHKFLLSMIQYTKEIMLLKPNRYAIRLL